MGDCVVTFVATYPKTDGKHTTSVTDLYFQSRNPIFYYTITRDSIPEPVIEKNEKPYFRKLEKKGKKKRCVGFTL